MKLVEQGSMPKLEAVNLATQLKAAEAGSGGGGSREGPQRPARALERHHQ